MTYHSLTSTPLGDVVLMGDQHHLTGLSFASDGALPPGTRDDARFQAAAQQLNEYFAGERTTFDVPVRLEGSDFEKTVWAALGEIPYGHTATYGEIAAKLGHPTAARAVGAANGRNPIAVIVPCHRVIGAAGALTGYAYGVDRKRALLELEGVLLAA
jgi:methylated-DNA-[protein]-cysteine S-methyltransferase